MKEIFEINISEATKKNWEKLGVTSIEDKLKSRANKKLSSKYITPAEYFENKDNIKLLENAVEKLRQLDKSIDSIMFNLGYLILEHKGLVDKQRNSSNPLIAQFLNEYKFEAIDDIDITEFSLEENDILGLVYQMLMTEGTKNKTGSYYTPKEIVLDMVSDIQLKPNEKVLDPCCGSLIYLLNIPYIKPENIYAMDKDPVAIMLSKFNFFIKFPQANVINIFHDDFLNQDKFISRNFDYIITNPPWGKAKSSSKAYSEITSGEAYSYFLIQSSRILKESGQMRFLLPESILNVKQHADIRQYLLEKMNIKSITLYEELFSGVTTKYVAISLNKGEITNDVRISHSGKEWIVDKNVYRSAVNNVFRLSTTLDEEIIEKVFDKKAYDLSNSDWALGIVTGDNKKKLLLENNDNLEKIYTGKDISPYRLKPSKYYIKYDRSQLQQVAKEIYYRSEQKLVYKFISNKLVFAVDETKSLFLNSANILIPKIPNMSVKSVAAFLNSELYQFLYIKLFREVKILKGNLMQLPFPNFDKNHNIMLTKMVDEFITGNINTDEVIQEFVYKYYDIAEDEKNYIKEVIHGKSKRSDR